jgi:hypothetical protein
VDSLGREPWVSTRENDKPPPERDAE